MFRHAAKRLCQFILPYALAVARASTKSSARPHPAPSLSSTYSQIFKANPNSTIAPKTRPSATGTYLQRPAGDRVEVDDSVLALHQGDPREPAHHVGQEQRGRPRHSVKERDAARR